MYIDKFIGQYLQPKMIHLYISVENSFVSYDYEPYVGLGVLASAGYSFRFLQLSQPSYPKSHECILLFN